MSKLWGVRHLRYWWHRYWLARWVDECRRHGLGLFAQQSDLDHLDAIWRGEK